MLALQITVLFIAWASATFGIWSRKKLDHRKAWIATLITSLGLIVGAALAITGFLGANKGRVEAEAQQRLLQTELSRLNQKYTDQKSRAETLLHQLRLALTGIELTNLEVQWVFHDVPPAVMDVFALGDAMDHANRLSDDEIDRLADYVHQRLRKVWRIENVLVPLVGIVSSGETDLKKLYKGDVSNAINAFRPSAPAYDDPDEVWFWVDYIGPKYNIVFPLNMDGSAALALGKNEDDRRGEMPERPEENLEYLHRIASSVFEAEARPLDKGFVLCWKYNTSSLRRASFGVQKVTAAFPVRFHFVSLQSGSRDYIEVLRDEPLDDWTQSNSPVGKWLERSEMTIIANGITEAATTYTVQRVGRRDRMLEGSKYDDPVKQYEYTLFEARRKSPSQSE